MCFPIIFMCSNEKIRYFKNANFVNMISNINDDEDDFSFILRTYYYVDGNFTRPRSIKMVPIFPKCNSINIHMQWNWTLLIIFLNELHNFKPKHHAFEIVDDELRFHFVKIMSNDLVDQTPINSSQPNTKVEDKKNYSISVFIKNNIMVTISIDLLFDKTIFDKEISCFNSKIGAENKKIKKPRSQAHIRFTKNFTT